MNSVIKSVLVQLQEWSDPKNHTFSPEKAKQMAEGIEASSVNRLQKIRGEHKQWSTETFGSVGPVGPAKHLSKEALEFAADPDDPIELADCQFLVWDMQWRAGITDEQLADAMVYKLGVCKEREWPEPKDGEAREHIRT